jgi:tetratricopeptide (TPR) repeat protein
VNAKRENVIIWRNERFDRLVMNVQTKVLPLMAMLLTVATTALCQTKAEQAAAYFNQGIAASKWHGEDDVGYRKMLRKAIADFTKAIQLKPDYAEAYFQRGLTKRLVPLQDDRGAIGDFTKAIQLKPDYAIAYANRGYVRARMMDFDGAIADYTKAIELKPDVVSFFDDRAGVKGLKRDLAGQAADKAEAARLRALPKAQAPSEAKQTALGSAPKPANNDASCAGVDASSSVAALIRAAADLGNIETLLANCPSLVFSKDAHGRTLLHNAAIEGRKDVAGLLLASKADVNAIDNDGVTPLMNAAAETAGGSRSHQDGAKQVMELLLDNGANVNSRANSNGAMMTALHYAVFNVGQHNRVDVVELLLSKGADVSARTSPDGVTPLALAASGGLTDIVELLLANKADVNAKAANGATPLSAAIQNHHNDVAELLRKHGGR